MKGYRLVLMAMLLAPAIAGAQYWFQTGARGGHSSDFNSGARLTIQTLTGQHVQDGSIAFWVGETLQNGAFIQAGYLIPNESGYYSTQCTSSGCRSHEFISKNAPEWFYEYFNPGNDSAFMGEIGPNDSAGANGTFHTYGFYSSGDTWYVTMDNTTLGQINLGTNNSGTNDAVAFVEAANVSDGIDAIIPVAMSNLSIYKDGKFIAAPYGYAYSGYGVGSMTSAQNPYGVAEVDNRVNYFRVGSNLPIPQPNEQLWQLGYNLNVISQYGNLSGTTTYLAYKNADLYAPTYIPLDNGTKAQFAGWSGYGASAYTGPYSDINLTMFSNITEIADWNIQYLIEVASNVGHANGTGWYDANSTATYSVPYNVVYSGDQGRWVFENWSTGQNGIVSNTIVTKPLQITANWQKQYLVNASSSYGGVSGSGWYAQNSVATIRLNTTYESTGNSTRIAFFSWNNGYPKPNITVNVTAPVELNAIFRGQSLATLVGIDSSGNPIGAGTFYIGNGTVANKTFLFDGYGYNVSGAYYKGVRLRVNQSISLSSPGAVDIMLPVYNIEIRTADVFGIPVNASVRLSFLNGTTKTVYSGPEGIIIVPNVPYGEATISATSIGQVVNTNTKDSSIARVTFVSDLDLEVLGGIVAAGIISYLLISRKLHNGIKRNQ